MRPRVFPAEDGSGIQPFALYAVGFNEAAGIPRGRHEGGPPLNLQIDWLQ